MARMAVYAGIGLALLLGAYLPALAEPPAEPGKYIEHLQFLGYQAEVTEQTLRVTHEGSPLNFTMKSFKGGVLLVAVFGVAANALESGPSHALLSLVNILNKEAWVSRFYFDDSDKTLTIEAWYGGTYDRERFGQFLQNWKSDTEDTLSRHAEEARRLLQ